MEKLNINFLKIAVALAVLSVSSAAFAGGFRFHSKAPVKAPVIEPIVQKRAYLFGYAGLDMGASYDTVGQFDYLPQTIPINFDLNNGFNYGGGFGFYSRFLGGSRFEFEGSAMTNDVGYLLYNGIELPADFEIRTRTIMFNMLKEFGLGRHAIGYAGGGVGYAYSKMAGDIDTIEYSDSSDGFAWQLLVGVDFPVTDSLSLFTQYRFLVLPDTDFTTNFGDFTYRTEDNPFSHAIQVGARVSF